jgi:murein DD-endopeptidase MepM/ murein hydrolase activator NlpD
MRSAPTPLHLGLALGLALSTAACSEPDTKDLVWPTSGTTEPQRVSSSFGPRLRGSKFDTYDFHRGVDIPVPPGSPIYAVAAGKVTRAGDDPAYTDRIVQIEHCAGDDCFYTNYIHLTGVLVSIGQEVAQGDLLALSGFGETGFPHLHFELRDGRPEQDHCVHPLHLLPTPGWLAPWVTLGPIDDADPAQASVEVTVSTPGLFPDLLAVDIATRDRATGAAIEERSFDLDAWNRDHTSPDMPDLIDDPDLDNIHVAPAKFNEETAVYTLTLRFSALTGAAAPGDLQITARARDVHGNESVATSP